MHTALTIAGSDSSGGAGVQADLKTMLANGVFGESVITALTAQNTMGVDAVMNVPADFIEAQMKAVFTDIYPDAVKIGMTSSVDTIEAIAAGLVKYKAKNIVLDPVMVATSGSRLLEENAANTLMEKLFPLADIITPTPTRSSTIGMFFFAAILAAMRIASKRSSEGVPIFRFSPSQIPVTSSISCGAIAIIGLAPHASSILATSLIVTIFVML